MTRVLLVGGGGREHALAWRFKQDDPSLELIAAPGNPGIAGLARCVAVGAMDTERLVALAQSERVDAVVVGPEAPLAAGLADRLITARIPTFGPVAAAAQLESSKRFAKEILQAAKAPTARATAHTDSASAKRAAHALGAPVVIKATGLAAGKGVVVCETIEDAERAIDDFLDAHTLGDAGSEVLIEEFMTGEEVSLFVLCDGDRGVPLIPAQDHKRLLAGDRGPNTGGMGAYAPVSLWNAELSYRVFDTIVAPTLATMTEHAARYRGLLYVGLMLTKDGPKVVEFNCRFGDPETQAVLPLLRGSLLTALVTIARGDSLDNVDVPEWDGRFGVTTVVAAEDYPGKPRLGDTITLPRPTEDVLVFHAGTATNANGDLVTAGGRVLAVTGVGTSFAAAQAASRKGAEGVRFAGKHFRSDIGWREQERAARGA